MQSRHNPKRSRPSATDARHVDRETTFVYNSRYLLESSTDPRDRTTQRIYNADGTLASVEVLDISLNPTGTKTSYKYDLLGRTDEVIVVIDAKVLTNPNDDETETTKYGYDKVGNLTSLTDPALNETTFKYDTLHRRTHEIQGDDETTDPHRLFVYDTLGNLRYRRQRFESGDDARAQEFTYDAHDRRTKDEWHGPGSDDYVASFEYDLIGNLTKATEDNFAQTLSTVTFDYDDLYRATEVTQSSFLSDLPDSQLAYEYDLVGNRHRSEVRLWDDTLQTPAFVADHENTFTIDELNRTTSIAQQSVSATLVDPKQVTFTYNTDSTLKVVGRYPIAAPSSADDAVVFSTYHYHDDGRIQSLDHQRALGSGSLEFIVQYDWQYDDRARISQYTIDRPGTDDDVTNNYSYDDSGQLTSGNIDAAGSNTTTDYDANGNRNGDGYTTAAFNRLTSDPNYTYEYDAEGNRTSRVANDFAETINIDGTQVTEGFVTNAPWLVDNTRGYDGQQYVLFATASLGPPVASTLWNFDTLEAGTYEVFVTWEAITDGSDDGVFTAFPVDWVDTDVEADKIVETVDFELSPQADDTHDGVNWQSIGELTLDERHKGIRVALNSDTVDPDGKLVADAVRIVRKEAEQHETIYDYDHRNRLTGVTIKDDAGVELSAVDYFYDVLGRRLGKEVDTNADNSPDEVEYYTHEGAQIALQHDATGVTRRNFWGPSVDQILAIEEVGTPNNEVLWTLADHQGTVRELFGDESGSYEVVETVDYDSHGRPLPKIDGDADLRTSFTYQGLQYDPETGLIYNRARIYDPLTRQFISEDQLGFVAGDTNLYRRAGNSPLNATDFSGNVATSTNLGSAPLITAGDGIQRFFESASGALGDFLSEPFDEAYEINKIPLVELTEADIERQNDLIDSGRLRVATANVAAAGLIGTAGALTGGLALGFLGTVGGSFGTAFGIGFGLPFLADFGIETVHRLRQLPNQDAIDRFENVGTLVAGLGGGVLGGPAGFGVGRALGSRAVLSNTFAPYYLSGVHGTLRSSILRSNLALANQQGVYFNAGAVPLSVGRKLSSQKALPAPNATRLRQDVQVNPTPPRALPTNRPVGSNAAQNRALQADIHRAQAMRARDIRVNQQQVNAAGQRVGINRPDLQYTRPDGTRVYIEYDNVTPSSFPNTPRGPSHLSRIMANDPSGVVELRVFL